jgi:hypothetical protein
MSKNKFESLLTLNGKELLSKRAENLGIDVEESFNEQKRVLNKRLRNLESEVFRMEDMSVKTTDSLVVGEGMNVDQWVKRRIEIELEKRDVQIELDTINKLIDDYFGEVRN